MSLESELDPATEKAIRLMSPDNNIRAKIRQHLLDQRGVEPGFVKLDDGRIVPEGGTQDNESGE